MTRLISTAKRNPFEPCHEKACLQHNGLGKTHTGQTESWFVSELVGNPKDRFSHNDAHTICAGNKNMALIRLCKLAG